MTKRTKEQEEYAAAWQKESEETIPRPQKPVIYHETSPSKFREAMRVAGLIIVGLIVLASIPFIVILVSAILKAKGVVT